MSPYKTRDERIAAEARLKADFALWCFLMVMASIMAAIVRWVCS